MSNCGKLIFANIASYVMLPVLSAAYVRKMHAVTPRVIWTAEAGDILVTATPVGNQLKAFASETLGVDLATVKTFAPKRGLTRHLADAVSGEDGLLSALHREVEVTGNVVFTPFALDEPTVALGRTMGLPFAGYDGEVPDSVVSEVRGLNTKSGFRRWATEYGYTVPPGETCDGIDELSLASEVLWRTWDRILIKLDRGSNGFGHRVIPRPARGRSLKATIQSSIADLQDQPQRFTVEAYLRVKWRPSVEFAVDSHGPTFLYMCDQRCPDDSFSGMITPPRNLPETARRDLYAAGSALGEYLYSRGYRGVFDIDACVTEDDQLFLTETNLRETGGTYLHRLAQRLLGDYYYEQGYVWIQDAIPSSESLSSFDSAVEALRNAQVLFSVREGRGAMPLVETAPIDGKWRYFLVGESANDAADLDSVARHALGCRT